MEVARDVELGLPQRLEARMALEQIDGLDGDLREAGLLEQPRTISASPSANGPGLARGSRLRRRRRDVRGPGPRPRSLSSRLGSSAQGFAWIVSQIASARRPPGRSTRRHSPSAAPGSAISMNPQRQRMMSTEASGRSIHSALRTLNSTFADAQLGRPLACPVEHRLGLVGDDRRAHRRDELRREHARLPQARGQLEHPLARLRVGGLDHPLRDGRRPVADLLLAANPAWSGGFPALEARVPVRLGIEAHESSRRRSFPDGVRGSGSLTMLKVLGTLNAARVRGAVRSRSSAGSSSAPGRATTIARDRLSPARVGASQRRPPRGRPDEPRARPRPRPARRSHRR